MTRDCFPDESLADVAGWDDADPRRAHLDGCPACRARLASYLSFLNAEDVAGADPEAAEAHLSAVLAGLVASSSASPVAKPRTARPAGSALRRAGRLRPALALAATVVVAVGLWRGLVPAPGQSATHPVLRGEGAAPPAPVVQPARALADGRLLLSWRRQALVDGYRVALHDGDLRQIALLDAGADSSLAVAPGEARFWRVLALRGGSEVGRTELAPLRAVE